MEGLSDLLSSLHGSRLTGAILIVLSVVAGYVFAGWFWHAREIIPLAQICARVDYLNILEEELREPLSDEMRNELAMLLEQCEAALKGRAEESN